MNSSGLVANGSSELDYCGNNVNSESLVSENSVKRIPAKVWFTLMFINGIWIISRFVS